MVNTQHVEETRSKRKSRDAKRARSFDGSSSKERLEIQDKPRFKKRVSNQVPSKFPKAINDRVSNPKSKGRYVSSLTKKPTFGKCVKNYGDYLKGTDNSVGCGKNGYNVRDCPNVRGQDKGSVQAQASGLNEDPKKNHFYYLRSRGELETYPDMVTSMLEVLFIDVYALLHPSATL
nr:uncharacterized protein LOC104648276 [Solanum lycopersicum]